MTHQQMKYNEAVAELMPYHERHRYSNESINNIDEKEHGYSYIPSKLQPFISSGWRRTLLLATIAIILIFLLNLFTFIWALAAHPTSYGSATLFTGSCSTSRTLNIIIHLVINVFSSIILGGSSYAMQCLSAPTRAEVDTAHASGGWMDIGVPSVRNLREIAKGRKWAWIVLGLSSVPLHLFFNSVVFLTTSASEYDVYVVNEAWLGGETVDTSDFATDLYLVETELNVVGRLWEEQRSGRMERLEPEACIDAYAQSFVSDRANMLAVVEESGTPSNRGRIMDAFSGGGIHITGDMSATNLDPYPWLCDMKSRYDTTEFCDIDEVRAQLPTWRLNGTQVAYCLSEPVEEQCKLRMSIPIAVLVLVLNLTKAITILLLVFKLKDKLLLSIGDAIASFLHTPDPTTTGSSLLSRNDTIKKGQGYTTPWGPRPYHGSRQRWLTAISRHRLLLITLTTTTGILISAILLTYGIHRMPGAPASSMWTLGFGIPTSHTLLTFAGIRRRGIRAAGVINNVLIANSGQAILSLFYFGWNVTLTSMLLADEWSSYARERKGLRVQNSRPRGAQRRSYFLQLPLRFGIPMILCSTVLHWLASQSIFLVSVEHYQNEYNTGVWVHDEFWDFATCAFSPLPLLIFVVLAAMLLVVLVCLSVFCRFKSGMPVAGSCSLAIAAACHVRIGEDGERAARLPLMWGVVEDGGGEEGVVRRCAFSSGGVEEPREGVVYG